MQHLPIAVNGSCRTRVGGTQHRARQFQRPHAADVAVLVNGYRVTKPGNIAHIDQHGRSGSSIRKTGRQLLAK